MTKPLSQAQRILKVLLDAKGEWVSACYFKRDMWITETNARISELRNQGWDVETKDERDEHGFAYHRIKQKVAFDPYELFEPSKLK
jgi:biotin operon repressor